MIKMTLSNSKYFPTEIILWLFLSTDISNIDFIINFYSPNENLRTKMSEKIANEV